MVFEFYKKALINFNGLKFNFFHFAYLCNSENNLKNNYKMSKHKKKKQKIKAKSKQKIGTSTKGIKPLTLQLGIVALLLTILVFYPSLQNDFVNWDDPDFVSNNGSIRLLTNIPHFFKSTVLGAYAPLVFTSYAIEYQLFNLDPFYYHLDNLLLHLGCVYLVFRIGLQLNLSIWAAVFFALLFGIHPMRVESVAWITERKDVLYGIFYLGAIFQYCRYLKTKNKKYLYYALGFFLPALLSKIQAVALPLSFLALDYYFKRPLKLKLIWEKIPFFAFSLLIGLVGIYFLRQQDILHEGVYTFFQSVIVGTNSLMIYLFKWIIPYPLVTVYPFPDPSFDFNWQLYLSLPVILAFFGGLVYLFKKGYRAVFFGFLFFLVNVLFMLQVVGAGQGYLADRYTYIPYFGLFFILAYGFHFFTKKGNAKYKKISYVVAGTMLVTFSALSWKQNKVWENSETLWTNALYHYPTSVAAFQNRGLYYEGLGENEKAAADFSKVLNLDPDNASHFKNYGKLLFNQGQYNQALETLSKGIAQDSEDPELYLNRGATYAALKQYQNALTDLNKVLILQPNEADAYFNRSNVYFEIQQYEAALKDMSQYLKYAPNYAEGWFRKGLMNSVLRNFSTALADFTKAISLDGQKGAYYFERGRIYEILGEVENGKADRQRAKELGF